MNANRRISLSLLVALLTALVMAISMALYAMVQYYRQDRSGAGAPAIGGLVLEHGWHVLVLGLVTYMALYAVLDRVVVKPIRALYVKLYAIARGDLTPTHLHSRVAEIQEMAEGINMMLSQVTTSGSLEAMIELARQAQRQLRALSQAEGGRLSPAAQHNLAAVSSDLANLVTAKQAGAIKKQEKTVV